MTVSISARCKSQSYSSRFFAILTRGRYRGSTKMSRHGHHRVRLVLSMTLSNAEAISHMAYGMLYRIHYATAYLALQYVHQWSRVAHDASAIAPEKKGRKRKKSRRGKSAASRETRSLTFHVAFER